MRSAGAIGHGCALAFAGWEITPTVGGTVMELQEMEPAGDGPPEMTNWQPHPSPIGYARPTTDTGRLSESSSESPSPTPVMDSGMPG